MSICKRPPPVYRLLTLTILHELIMRWVRVQQERTSGEALLIAL